MGEAAAPGPQGRVGLGFQKTPLRAPLAAVLNRWFAEAEVKPRGQVRHGSSRAIEPETAPRNCGTPDEGRRAAPTRSRSFAGALAWRSRVMIGTPFCLSPPLVRFLNGIPWRAQDRQHDSGPRQQARKAERELLRDREHVLAPYRGRPGSGRLRPLLWIGLPLACVVYGGMFALSSAGGASAALAAPVAALGLLGDLGAAGRLVLPHSTRTLRTLLLSYLVALLVWPNYLAFALPGLPWITFIRLIGFPLTIVFLAGLSVSAEMRREIWQAMTAAPWLSGLVVAFFMMQLLSVFESRGSSACRSAWICSAVTLVSWTAVYFISIYVFLQPGAALALGRAGLGLGPERVGDRARRIP